MRPIVYDRIGKSRRRIPAPRRHRPLRLERLESRWTPAVDGLFGGLYTGELEQDGSIVVHADTVANDVPLNTKMDLTTSFDVRSKFGAIYTWSNGAFHPEEATISRWSWNGSQIEIDGSSFHGTDTNAYGETFSIVGSFHQSEKSVSGSLTIVRPETRVAVYNDQGYQTGTRVDRPRLEYTESFTAIRPVPQTDLQFRNLLEHANHGLNIIQDVPAGEQVAVTPDIPGDLWTDYRVELFSSSQSADFIVTVTEIDSDGWKIQYFVTDLGSQSEVDISHLIRGGYKVVNPYEFFSTGVQFRVRLEALGPESLLHMPRVILHARDASNSAHDAVEISAKSHVPLIDLTYSGSGTGSIGDRIYQQNPGGEQVWDEYMVVDDIHKASVHIENRDTRRYERFRIGSETLPAGWDVKYFLIPNGNTVGRDVTAEVRQGIGSASQGEYLEVQVIPGDDSEIGSRAEIIVNALNHDGQFLCDAFKLTYEKVKLEVNTLGDLRDSQHYKFAPDVDPATPGVQITLGAALDFMREDRARKMYENIPENRFPFTDSYVLREPYRTLAFNLPVQGKEPPVIVLNEDSNRDRGNTFSIYAHNLTLDGTSQPGAGRVSIDARKLTRQMDVFRIGGSHFLMKGFEIGGNGGSSIAVGETVRSYLLEDVTIDDVLLGTNFPIGSGIRARANFVIDAETGERRIEGKNFTVRNSTIVNTTNAAITFSGVSDSVIRNNVIGNTAGSAIRLTHLTASANGVETHLTHDVLIEGNFLGVGRNGEALPIGTDGTSGSGIELLQSHHVTIGGSSPSQRNVIGNSILGINVTASLQNLHTEQVSIVGNYIGFAPTPAGGFAPAPNSTGIRLEHSRNTTIGGTTLGDRNYIGGSRVSDISITGNDNMSFPDWFSTDNRVIGNVIGETPDGRGMASLPGTAAIGIQVYTSKNTVIGGTGPEHSNVISNHGGVGIRLSQGLLITPDATILGNRIYNNVRGAIQLGYNSNGTPNDLGDLDGGPNGLQNKPILTQTVDGGLLKVDGVLDSKPNTTYRIELFGNPRYRMEQAEVVLQAFEVTTNAEGRATFSRSLPLNMGPIAATATDPEGRTSELLQPQLVVNTTSDLRDASAGDDVLDVDPLTRGFQVSLRAALEFAESTPETEIIRFDIRDGGSTPLTNPIIQVESALLPVTRSVVLDASTQPGGVTVSGKQGEDRLPATGLLFAGGETMSASLTGITVTGFAEDGIAFDNPPHSAGSMLFLSHVSSTDNLGLGLRSTASNVRIEQSVFHSNGEGGVLLEGVTDATDIEVIGSEFGVEPVGDQPTRSNGVGLELKRLTNVRVGGTEAGTGNRIYSHLRDGIRASDVSRLTVEGNLVGVTPSGLRAGSLDAGISLRGVFHATIGGTTPEARNAFSGNNGPGIEIRNLIEKGHVTQTSHHITIQGNWIGVDNTETLAVGNRGDGILVQGATDVQIGGTTGTWTGNVIGANRGNGIRVIGPAHEANPSDPTSMRVRIQGNWIGISRDPSIILGNYEDGIRIEHSSDNVIGWDRDPGIPESFAKNHITSSERDGVTIVGETAKRNSILGNLIYRNGVGPQRGLPIDLGDDGADFVDEQDTDDGPNARLNRPTVFLGQSEVPQASGELRAAPNQVYRLEFFADGGERFLEGVDVTTDSLGVAEFHRLLEAIEHGIRVTATDREGNTSEFNGRVVYVNSTEDASDVAGDDVPDVDAGEGGLQTTLRAALEYADQSADVSEIRLAVPLDDDGRDVGLNAFVVAVTTALPLVPPGVRILGQNTLGGGHLWLDGGRAPAGTSGLQFAANGGLSHTTIHGFPGNGLSGETLLLESASAISNLEHGVHADTVTIGGTGNVFRDNGQAGLKVAELMAQNIVVQDNRVGIDASNVELRGDENRIVENDEDGIRALGNVVIDKAFIGDQKLGDGIEAGGEVIIRQSAQVVRNGSKLTNPLLVDGHGISASGRVEARNLVVADNHGYGIELQSVILGNQRRAVAELSQVTIEHNGLDGIRAGDIEVNGGVLRQNGHDGLFATESAVLLGVEVLNNAAVGVRSLGNLTFRGGKACGNPESDIVALGNKFIHDVELCDEDLDGVDEAMEDGGPNGGDGNGDGILDSAQDHVASFAGSTGRYVTLVTSVGQPLVAVQSVATAELGTTPDGTEFPLGAVRFSIVVGEPGGHATVDVITSPDEPIDEWWMHSWTSDDSSEHWWLFDDDGTTGAQWQADSSVRVRFVDGGRGDSDGLANGVVVDPGAPALDPVPHQNKALELDANNDGAIVPLDALVIINDLNARGSRQLTGRPSGSHRLFLDTNGDAHVTPQDVLLVINHLNRGATGGEGESPSHHDSTSSARRYRPIAPVLVDTAFTELAAANAHWLRDQLFPDTRGTVSRARATTTSPQPRFPADPRGAWFRRLW